MSKTKRLAKNTLFVLVSRAIQPVMSLVLFLVVARVLGPEIFGKYTVIFQLYLVFQVTSSFGLRLLLTREIAANKDEVNKYFANGMLLNVPLVVVNVGMMLLLIVLLNYETDISIGAYIIAISLIASSFVEVGAGVLGGFEDFQKYTIGWIIFLVIKTVASIVALLTGYGLISLIVIHVVTKYLHAGITLLFALKYIDRSKLQLDPAFSKKLFSMTWSLALLIIITQVFWRIDIIVLSKIVSNEEVGNYSAAYKLFKVILLGIRSFFVAFFPVISAMYVEKPEEFQNACRKAIRYLVILTLPLVIVIAFTAPDFMPLIWGAEFGEATLVLQILIWSLIPFTITEVLGSAFVASNRQKTHMTLNIIVLLIKLALVYFLSIKYGAIGSAIATIIGLVILTMLQLPFIIPRIISLNYKSLSSTALKLGVASLAMIPVVFYVSQINFIAAALVSIMVYGLVLVLLNTFPPDDRKYLNRMVKRTA